MKKIFDLALAAALALMSATSFAAIDVNKANQAELESIKGIGPAMSGKIIEARKAGSFKDWADMQARVKGVRNATSAKFSGEGLTVNGSAYAGSPAGAVKGTAKKNSKVASSDGTSGSIKPAAATR